jgi:hypothetical protein
MPVQPLQVLAAATSASAGQTNLEHVAATIKPIFLTLAVQSVHTPLEKPVLCSSLLS